MHVQRWAAGIVSRGYDVRVVSLGGAPLDGIDTVTFPRQSRLSYFTVLSKAVAAARAFQPDLVHVHSAAAFGLWGLRADIHPTVVSVWGSDVVDFPSNPWRKMYLRRVLRKADAITATSRFLRSTTLALCSKAADRLSVIPFGVDIPDQILPLSDGPLRLCCLKSHKPIYGLDTLVRSMAQVVKSIPDARLTLAGHGPQTSELKDLAHRLKLDEQIDFCGLLDAAGVRELLGRSHLMVMPSLREAFGVAALEASACGRVVIATDAGGIPEVVHHGETGLLVPPGDAAALAETIIKLGHDRTALYRMGEAGPGFVSANYTWSKSLDAMTALYEKLLNG